jgi:hypothetical protein
MYKVCRCFASDNSAKKAHLLHGCNLALLALLLCTSLLMAACAFQRARLKQIALEYQATRRVSVSGVRDQNGGFALDVRIKKT